MIVTFLRHCNAVTLQSLCSVETHRNAMLLNSLDSRRLGAGDSKNYLFFFFFFIFYFSFFFFFLFFFFFSLFFFFFFYFSFFFIFPFFFFFIFLFFFFFFCLSSIKKNIINNLLFLPLCAGPVKPTRKNLEPV